MLVVLLVCSVYVCSVCEVYVRSKMLVLCMEPARSSVFYGWLMNELSRSSSSELVFEYLSTTRIFSRFSSLFQCQIENAHGRYTTAYLFTTLCQERC